MVLSDMLNIAAGVAKGISEETPETFSCLYLIPFLGFNAFTWSEKFVDQAFDFNYTDIKKNFQHQKA